ncbi:MAG TPA: hypothetical protein VGD40_02435 [Chryseosolibacter sp.]
MKNLGIKILVISVTTTALEVLLNFLFTTESFNPGNVLLYFFPNVITCVLAAVLMRNFSATGFERIVVVFFYIFLIGHFNTLVEAYVFNVTGLNETVNLLGRGLILCAFQSAITGMTIEGQPNHGLYFPGWRYYANKVLVADFLYLILYLAAGVILQSSYDGLMEFYAGRLPSLPVMILLQLCLRGVIFGVVICSFAYHMQKMKRLSQAVLCGAMLAMLGGIIPLLYPNDLMPAGIRIGHAIEVGISNFLFGFLMIYAFIRRHHVATQVRIR